jgi:quercetin dioxygenase-like cupin family protein
MNDAVTVTSTPTVAKKNAANYIAGRRAFFKYRDLGVTAATGGRLRAQVTSAEAGMSQPTGWHIHKCEAQLVYMLSGWIELEFAGEPLCRLEAGDSIMIPGNTPHNELRTSDTFELLEISLPAEMATEPCDAPG